MTLWLVSPQADELVEADPLAEWAPPDGPANLDLTAVGAPQVTLAELLHGRGCRWCQRPVAWQGSNAVALADGTGLHGACREPFHVARITRNALPNLECTV